MAELAETFPAGEVQCDVGYHRCGCMTPLTKWMKTFVEAIILVVLVIFFLPAKLAGGSYPMPHYPCIPYRNIGSNGCLGLYQYPLTLFGLILAIAIVVDDAIVVTENATRILDEGKLDARAATEQAMGRHRLLSEWCWYCLPYLFTTTLISGISAAL